MTATLITGIGELTTNDDTRVDAARSAPPGARARQAIAAASRLRDAAVVLEGDRVVWIGPARHAPAADRAVDVGGRAVLPGWVDAHTHLVFAGDRTAEFEARMAGESYRAGGIHTTVRATRAATDRVLTANLRRRVAEAVAGGTTTLETKTGYGLSVAEERRSARIARAGVDRVTFLGAHVAPEGADGDAYVALVTGQMLSAVREFVTGIDVFCEEGAFTAEQAERVLAAGAAAGLRLHVHGNQLGPGPGIRVAVAHRAASVDHCNFVSDADLELLADSWRRESPGTLATVLPACDLSTRAPLAPARRLLDAGVPVAIASNANPGTSFTSAVGFCVAQAVLQMRLTVAEAVRAATLGGAMALGCDPLSLAGGGGAEPPRGVLAPGARADLQVLDAPSVTHLAYRPGVPLTLAVWRAGRRVRDPRLPGLGAA